MHCKYANSCFHRTLNAHCSAHCIRISTYMNVCGFSILCENCDWFLAARPWTFFLPLSMLYLTFWQRCLLSLAKVSLTFGKGVSYLWQRFLLLLAKVSLTYSKGVSYLWQRCLLPLAKAYLTFGKGVSYL